MKNTIIYTGFILSIIISSCSSSSSEERNINDTTMVEASIIDFGNSDSSSANSLDSSASAPAIPEVKVNEVDSVMNKMNDLIKSTHNSDKKVAQIKVMNTENQSLKKELKETKSELKEAKEQISKMDSVIKVNEKKGFFRKVIDNIKGVKDSTNTDTAK